MTHIKGTPKVMKESPPKPDGGRIYYDNSARVATVDVTTTEDGTLVLVRRNSFGTAVDKFIGGRDFHDVIFMLLPFTGSMVLVEANPGHWDWKIIGTTTEATEDAITSTIGGIPRQHVRIYYPETWL